MKGTQMLLVCALITLCAARLDIGNMDCNKYLSKFGTANSVDGVGATSLAYSGEAAFVGDTANVKVSLRYSDPLFNDATFFGLVQEDGKTADATCLDLKLYKFTSNAYSDAVQVTDLPLTASNNFQKQWRYLSFTIQGADLGTRTQQASNSNNFVYTGYYAVAYYAAGTTQVQYTFYFQFSVTVNKSTGAAVDTVFHPLNQKETLGCAPGATCTQSASTSLKFCTDLTCSAFATPNLFLNDQFVLKQAITTSGMENFYLVGTQVWYTGSGLNKQTTPITVTNSAKGSVILQLKADIAWSAVTIKVTSYLSTTQTASRRLLQATTTTYDPVTGNSESITCIKTSSTASTCPTCEEECASNGFSREGCAVCNGSSSNSQLLTFAFMALLLLFTF